ncbi:phage tail assembly protein [Chromohalobacter sp.]|uniref:phage tail assembly protein n=1 Tax=Chromohalobacter sp. TaxID=50740 RepID=UPI003242CF3A
MNAARGICCALLTIVAQWLYVTGLIEDYPSWVYGIPAVLIYFIASGALMPHLYWRKTMAQAKEKATATNVSEPIELDTPIKRGETEISEVTLRKPSAGELRGVNLADVLQMQTDALMTLIPRLSNPSLTAPEVRHMDPADLVQCGGEVAGFLISKRAKGEDA